MSAILQPFLSIVVGLALACYGLIFSITRYPGQAAFDQLASDLPTLGAVLFFISGVAAVLVGLVVLVLSVRRLRARWRHLAVLTNQRAYAGADPREEREWSGNYR